MEVMEKAASMERAGEDIVHLEVGEPDFDTPECIKEAAIRASADGKTHYTHSLGVLELREAIAEHYHNQYGVEVSPDRSWSLGDLARDASPLSEPAGAGGSNPANPYYACYPNFVLMAEGKPTFLNVYEEEPFNTGRRRSNP